MKTKSATTIFDYAKKAPTVHVEPEDIEDDRHVATLKLIEKYSKSKVQSNLKQLDIQYDINRKTRVVLALLPEWDPNFPPYNIAKIAAVTKAAGYFCKSYDFNIGAYRYFEKNLTDIVDSEPWNPLRDFHWVGDHYYNTLHPHLKSYFDQQIDTILDNKPDVVGFSIYYCNIEPVKYFATELKKRNPNIKIVVGGSHAHGSFFKGHESFDYIVNGEGENLFLNILTAIEHNTEVVGATERNNQIYVRESVDDMYDLSNMPMPDYSDFDFSQYQFPNGALCELSRGCVAKCRFCEETHFWKYRQRKAVSALDEVRHMYYTYGTDVFWFNDSLVNGSLDELRAFVKGVATEKLDIVWTGYSRCNGKMDAEFYKDLAAGGCKVLNYGIESGSQTVLNAMNKAVTIEEMEQNLRDGNAAGIQAMTNWIVGFPNERYKEFEDTLTFLWRNRNNGITAIAQGTGFIVGVDSIIGQNLSKFDLLEFYYYNHWITKDFAASIGHKMIKNKCFSIFTDFLPTELTCSKPTRPNLAAHHYTIEFNNPIKINDDIEYDYDDFDYQIIKPNINPFADSLVNEIWPLLHIFWKTRGGYKLRLIFDKELDEIEWGKRGSLPLDAEYIFEIDDIGNWTADFSWDFKQEVKPEEEYHDVKWTDETGKEFESADPMGPVWSVVDFSRDNSNSSARARAIAWKDDPTKQNSDVWNAYNEQEYLDRTVEFKKYRMLDFSFIYSWQGEGTWKK